MNQCSAGETELHRDFWKAVGAGGWDSKSEVPRPGHGSEVGQRIPPVVYFLTPKCLSSAVKDLPVSGLLVSWWVSVVMDPGHSMVPGKHSALRYIPRASEHLSAH